MIPINIALVLLIIGGLVLWLVIDSKVSHFFKGIIICLFCLFVINFFFSLSSFLGRPALERDMPETVRIVAVYVKEPNFRMGEKGAIYLTLDSVNSIYDNNLLNMLHYPSKKNEPRLFGLPYSRQLHEQLEKEVIPKTQRGQIVTGKLSKSKGKPGGKKGSGKEGKESDGKGGGSESQEQEYQFRQQPLPQKG